MSTLHLIFSSKGCERATLLANEGDSLVLMGDAVYEINSGSYALADDLKARGISHPQAISNSRLVELTIEDDKVVSWP